MSTPSSSKRLHPHRPALTREGHLRDTAPTISPDLLKALLDRVNIPAALVEDIHWGCVKQEKEQGYDVARMAALIAGMPIEVGGVTVNRNCGSSLQPSTSAPSNSSQLRGSAHRRRRRAHAAHSQWSRLRPQPALLLPPQPSHPQHGSDRGKSRLKYRISAKSRTSLPFAATAAPPRRTDSGAFAKESHPDLGPRRKRAARNADETNAFAATPAWNRWRR